MEDDDKKMEEAKAKFKDLPDCETLEDVEVVLGSIAKYSPNLILHLASYGCRGQAATLVRTMPIDFEAEVERLGVNMDDMFDRVRPEKEYGIVDREQLLLPMVTSILVNVGREYNLDTVKAAEAMVQVIKNLRRDTRGAV